MEGRGGGVGRRRRARRRVDARVRVIGVSLLVTRLATSRQLLCCLLSAVCPDWRRGTGGGGRGCKCLYMPHCTALKPTCQCDSSQAGNRQALMYLTNSTCMLHAPLPTPTTTPHHHPHPLPRQANFFNWLSQQGSVTRPLQTQNLWQSVREQRKLAI